MTTIDARTDEELAASIRERMKHYDTPSVDPEPAIDGLVVGTLPPCPSWCEGHAPFGDEGTVVHQADVKRDDLDDIAMPDPDGGDQLHSVDLVIECWESLNREDGTIRRKPPRVIVDYGSHLALTSSDPAQLRALGAALIEAADQLQEATWATVPITALAEEARQ